MTCPSPRITDHREGTNDEDLRTFAIEIHSQFRSRMTRLFLEDTDVSVCRAAGEWQAEFHINL